jgi:ribonucleoside-diphosphate reductase alpha chain
MTNELNTDVARLIWESRYRYCDPQGEVEQNIEQSWRRVAKALASVERSAEKSWESLFFELMRGFHFLPAGRILAGAGIEHQVTLFNCFVMGTIEDSMEAIFDALKEGAVTMQQGGGVGYDFSTLRPSGSEAHRVGSVASGPVSFMRVWDSMCDTLISTSSRRGAMMAALRCDHPDIENFINAKRDPRELCNFNLSVLVSDDFMQAVEQDEEWLLLFPLDGIGGVDRADGLPVELRIWSGSSEPVPCAVLRRMRARDLWQQIMLASYETAEPGVLFIDRINQDNNLAYRETICATNPCGELPLPPYGACNLGSLNLTRFVRAPFSERAEFDQTALREATTLAVRLLDNVIDLSHFPFEAQSRQAHGSRRIGLGLTGLADAMIMLGLDYDSAKGRDVAAATMREICHQAYRASIELGREKGAFPFLDREKFLSSPLVRQLPQDIRQGIAEHGLRNSHLTAIAPTGTISLLAGNVSSGIEPIFEFDCQRRIRDSEGVYACYPVTDYAVRKWREQFCNADLNSAFVEAHDLAPSAHLEMQAALQPYVDSAISKTVNVPRDYPFEDFRNLYRDAYRLGLKGCTTYRPNEIRGEILSSLEAKTDNGTHCCGLEREGD